MPSTLVGVKRTSQFVFLARDARIGRDQLGEIDLVPDRGSQRDGGEPVAVNQTLGIKKNSY